MATAYDVLVETEAILRGERTQGDYPTRWIQYAGQDHHGGYCLMGALLVAVKTRVASVEAHTSAYEYLLSDERVRGRKSVPAFNDQYGRTLAEVLDLLHRAQAKALAHEIPVLAHEPESELVPA